MPCVTILRRFALAITFLLVSNVSAQVPDTTGQADAPVAVVQVELPNGQIAKRDSVSNGETFTLAGFPFPLQYLNGGELTLPDSALIESVTITVRLPDFAAVQGQGVSFGDSVASAVTFDVTRGDSAVSPYEFNRPVELTLPMPQELPPAVGTQVSGFVLAFIEEGGAFDTTGVRTVVADEVEGIVKAEVAHFSTLGMTSQSVAGGETSTHATRSGEIPAEYTLHQNYPNPFNPSTLIRYDVPESGLVRISVYNALGQRVALLADGMHTAGSHSVKFEALSLPSGMYMVSMDAGALHITRSIVLVR